MKNKSILVLSLCCIGALSGLAQENTLPTSGNVGIGTLNPSNKLDVFGDARIKQNLRVENQLNLPNLNQTNGLDGMELLVIDGGGGISRLNGNQGTALSNIVYAEKVCGSSAKPTWANGTDKIYSTCMETKIGIGTNAPRVNLDNRGTTYSNKLVLGNIEPGNTTAFFHLKSNLGDGYNTPVFIIENMDQRLLQLNNNGVLLSREIKVNRQSWADYVFDAHYELMPLGELKNYLLLHKHLPHVPDEETVLKEGIELGEMNKILLEKIEELTLYLVAQNEVNVKQAEELARLQDEIKLLKR